MTSKEEMYFKYYLEELQNAGYIKDIIHQPTPFMLSKAVEIAYIKKVKNHARKQVKHFTLLHELTYTPDFKVSFTMKGYGWLFEILTDGMTNRGAVFYCDKDHVCYIDTKGEHRNIHYDSHITFPIKQKMTYDKYGIYVQKIVIPDIFKHTFTPKRVLMNERYVKTDKLGRYRAGDFKYKYIPITLEDFVKSIIIE